MSVDLIFDKGQNFSMEITHEKDGFLINYYDLLFDETKLEEISNLNSMLDRIKRVSNELEINLKKFIIEFQYDCGTAYCLVDKNQVLLLSLPVTIRGKKMFIDSQGIHEDYLLYHELMHAKEFLEGRFPSIGQLGPEDYIEIFVGRLNDFANEGKLEAMGKPHESRKKSIENIYKSFIQDIEFGSIPLEKGLLLTIEVVTELCDRVWGKSLKADEAHKLASKYLFIE
jgi:hypothetical protein